jgi:hypothetical protein
MLTAILARRPAASIDDVVDMMNAIDGALPASDGLKWFNRLYLSVTLEVRAKVGAAAAFRDPAFLARLDVVFANLYFDAAAAGDRAPSAAPPAWRPLFETRSTPGLLPIQHALAGMNAHINRDLPQALVSTFQALGGAPDDESPRHDDFERVNGILGDVEAGVKAEFATGIVAAIDAAAGRADDAVAMWSVAAARDAAWTHARVRWALGDAPILRDAFFARFDRLTGFTGRGRLPPRLAAL